MLSQFALQDRFAWVSLVWVRVATYHIDGGHRLDSVRVVLANGMTEDPLESEEQLQEQMDSLPYMCRFQYEYAVELIVGRMDPIVAAYQKVL
jgi:hypothetical protein